MVTVTSPFFCALASSVTISTTEFAVEVNLVADLAPMNPFDFFLEPEVVNYPFAYATDLRGDLEPYLATEAAGPRLGSFVAEFAGERRCAPVWPDTERWFCVPGEHGGQSCAPTSARTSAGDESC